MEYLKINKKSWDDRVEEHYKSEFYDVPGFLEGKSSLHPIELELLGDLKGKSVLHLQCHFGQDSVSLSRLQAEVTGVDFSDKAIQKAKDLAHLAGENTKFICSEIYDLPNQLHEQFDVVFTSYGTIGWLPDLDKWARVISHFLKPKGTFVFAEFHPFVWMYNEAFNSIDYNYFNEGPIEETENGTYANKNAPLKLKHISWNHALSEVIQNLIKNDIRIEEMKEYDYSPYPIFKESTQIESNKYQVKGLEGKIPLVYAIKGISE